MQSALEAAIAELVLGPELDPQNRAAVAAWLGRHGVGEEDSAALRSGGLARLLVYRRLVRENLREAMRLGIPRAIARLGPLFDEYFGLFLDQRGPRTHYLRDVTREFINFCEPLFRRDERVPPYLVDLARHESLRIEIGACEDHAAQPLDQELELDQSLRFIEAARLVEYGYAVHDLGEDEDNREVPEARRTYLFVYRSPEHEVRYLELTRLASEILRRLMADGDSLRAALVGACKSHGVALQDTVLEGTARVLADLAERGVLLGAAVQARRSGQEATP
jgi:hypothetical protein